MWFRGILGFVWFVFVKWQKGFKLKVSFESNLFNECQSSFFADNWQCHRNMIFSDFSDTWDPSLG